MSKITSVINAAKKISKKPLSVASLGIGAACAASVVYDTHINGKEKALADDRIYGADRLFKQHKQFMEMDKSSASLAKAKSLYYDSQFACSYYHLYTKLKGYIKGAGQTLINALPVVGLSALAIKFHKNIVGKASGILLGVHAVKTLLYDVVGIGNKSDKK